jgi:cbb3-type cytochrome oxidase subunit 3
MMRQLIDVFPMSGFAAASLFIFLGLFIFILFFVFKFESKNSLAAKAQIPLHDDRIQEKTP